MNRFTLNVEHPESEAMDCESDGEWVRYEDVKKLLLLAGEMSDAARTITGGHNITVGSSAPVNITNISAACADLRDAVDAYDKAIIADTWRSIKCQSP